MSQKMYVVYDGRALAGKTDDAAVIDASCHSVKEARLVWRRYHYALYQYDVGPGNELINEEFVEEL